MGNTKYIASFVTYYSTYCYLITHPMFKKAKNHTLKLKLEAGKSGGSNRSRVSNRSRGCDGIVVIQAGGFY